MRDPRDEPTTDTDVNGDSYYVTKKGSRIPIKNLKQASAMKKLEDAMRYEMAYGWK